MSQLKRSTTSQCYARLAKPVADAQRSDVPCITRPPSHFKPSASKRRELEFGKFQSVDVATKFARAKDSKSKTPSGVASRNGRHCKVTARNTTKRSVREVIDCIADVMEDLYSAPEEDGAGTGSGVSVVESESGQCHQHSASLAARYKYIAHMHRIGGASTESLETPCQYYATIQYASMTTGGDVRLYTTQGVFELKAGNLSLDSLKNDNDEDNIIKKALQDLMAILTLPFPTEGGGDGTSRGVENPQHPPRVYTGCLHLHHVVSQNIPSVSSPVSRDQTIVTSSARTFLCSKSSCAGWGLNSETWSLKPVMSLFCWQTSATGWLGRIRLSLISHRSTIPCVSFATAAVWYHVPSKALPVKIFTCM